MIKNSITPNKDKEGLPVEESIKEKRYIRADTGCGLGKSHGFCKHFGTVAVITNHDGDLSKPTQVMICAHSLDKNELVKAKHSQIVEKTGNCPLGK